MSDNKTIDNVHVHIYGHEMLGEVISRARKNNIPYDKDMYYDFHSHGLSYLVLKDRELTLLEDPSEKHGEEISLNGFFELYLSKEEVKKELEVGKWYFGELDNERKTLFCFNGKHGQFTQYGFTSNREWSNQIGCIQGLKYTEATPQEVEKALIEEANRRGFNGGFVFDDRTNILWNQQKNGEERAILSNGQWATIIEQDKFSELKEAHNKGAVIESMPKKWIGDWTIATNPIWDGDNYEYRIKPEEKPNVGDVVEAWNNNSSAKPVIGMLEDIHLNTHYGIGGQWYDNAKTLTQREAIELLFPNK